MSRRYFSVGTFNAFNLVRAEVPYYGGLVYTPDEFDQKAAWMAAQLQRMDADVIGFQEVFHEDALEAVVARSGGYAGAKLLTAGADGTFPAVGLVSRLPILESEVIADFPEAALVELNGQALPLTKFSRPVLRAKIELPTSKQVDVFVIHLKSKRPEVPDDLDHHDPIERAKGKMRSLIIRAAEAVALRTLLIQRIKGKSHPVVVVGDANDARDAVTTEIVAGTAPWRRMPREVKEKIWDVLLYDVKEAQPRKGRRDVTYTHIHNGVHGSLDHIFVSQEFMRQNPEHVAHLETIRELNDHLFDETFSSEPGPRWSSDHGQVTARFLLRRPKRPRA